MRRKASGDLRAMLSSQGAGLSDGDLLPSAPTSPPNLLSVKSNRALPWAPLPAEAAHLTLPLAP